MLKRIARRIYNEVTVRLPIIQHKKDESVVVSLTSYPARLQRIHIVIRSLLKQTVTPHKVILYLGSDTKESDIPAKLKKLHKYNFEIRTGYENLKPHKKYYYAMQEFPDKHIITVDDDLIYDKNLVKDLLKTYEVHPGCVCARRVNQMTKNTDGTLASYNDFNWEYKGELEPSHQLLATGCGGILYPPHMLPVETFNLEGIKNQSLDTDDLWLKFMELKNNIKVVWTNSKVVHPLSLRNTQHIGLMQTNTKNENRNDINIKNLIEYTGINPADYF